MSKRAFLAGLFLMYLSLIPLIWGEVQLQRVSFRKRGRFHIIIIPLTWVWILDGIRTWKGSQGWNMRRRRTVNDAEYYNLILTPFQIVERKASNEMGKC